MGRILITGASGNVGRYVAEYALKNGQEITAAGTHTEKLSKLLDSRAQLVRFDFMDPATYDTALKDADRVFIMRPPQLGRPEDLKPFIDRLKDRGGIRLVSFLSLIGVENNPAPPHHKIEKYIEQAGLPFCHIRPGFFMQNLSGVHAFEIKHIDRIVVPVGKALTSFIDAEDIGEFTAKVLAEPDRHLNRGYAITGDKAIDYYQAAKIFSEELGRTITYANPRPSLAARYWTQVRGLDREYSAVMGMLYRMTRLGTAKKVTSVYEDVMGKKTRSFREFVRRNIEAWEQPEQRRICETCIIPNKC